MRPVPSNTGDLAGLDPAPIWLDECPPFHNTFRKRPEAIVRRKSIGASVARPPPNSLGPVSRGEVATEVWRVGDFDGMFEPYVLIEQVAEFAFFGGGEVPVDVVLSVEEVRNLQLGIRARCRRRGRWLGQDTRFVNVHAYCGWVVWSGRCGVGSSIIRWSGVGTGKGHVHIGTRNSGLWLGFGLGLSARVVEMRGVVARGGGRAVTIGSFCDGPFRGGGPGTTCNDGGCSKSFSRDAIRVHIRTRAIIVRNIHIYVVVIFFFLGDILCVSKSPFLVFTGLFGGRNRRWKNDRGRWHGQGWYGCR